ncbi:MAG: response regulator [Verrucomicrobia bacterium]|jgi:CheY-like chemotaxis protein|nr:response regulator [Verrucomicrobiota bacterium]MBT7702311.1 response regulator [Verrucomicrobiota bacterium]
MILIVDDDARMIATLRTVLEHEGESVVTASNGVEAYGMLKSQPCTMMLMDVNMPELSGTELLKLLKDEDIRIPTIVMTGNEDCSAASFAAYPSVIGFERKPFDVMKLAAMVRDYRGQKVRISVVTATRRIDGDLTMPAAVDLPAFLEQAGEFIVLDNAAVTHTDGSTVLEASEVCLRVDSIVCVSADKTVSCGRGAQHGAD